MSDKIREEVDSEFAHMSYEQRDSIYRSRIMILENQGKKLDLIKVDMGPYASRIYKFDMFREGEHYMAGNDKLKFLHFNNDEANRKLSNRQAKMNRSRTVAVLALSPNAITKNAAMYASLPADGRLFVEMAVGVEKVSLDDNYNKTIGRDRSVGQMREMDLEVVGLTMNENHIFLHFAEYEGVKISVRLNRKTGFSTVVGKMDEPANKA